MTELELESEFIWDETKRDHIKDIINQLYDQLTQGYSCFIKIDEFNCLNFCFDEYEEPKLRFKNSGLSPCDKSSYSPPSRGSFNRLNHDEWFKLSARTVNDARDFQEDNNDALRYLKNIGFSFTNVYKCTPKIFEFIQSLEAQEECFHYILEGRKDMCLKPTVEADYDIVIDPMERSSFVSNNKGDPYFKEIDYREDTPSDQSEAEFKIEYGRELVKLYTLICDSQHRIDSFILNYASTLVNEENIVLFIEYGLMNGYICPQLMPKTKSSKFKLRGRQARSNKYRRAS